VERSFSLKKDRTATPEGRAKPRSIPDSFSRCDVNRNRIAVSVYGRICAQMIGIILFISGVASSEIS
jgi:hypothetical protein